MNMSKSSMRAYKMNIAMYGKEGENMDSVVLPANHCVLEKIGYDDEKRPLYTMRIADGCRSIGDLGYVVPVGTTPAYELGSPEVQMPTCTNCLQKGDKMPSGEEVEEDHKCNCGSDMCWCN